MASLTGNSPQIIDSNYRAVSDAMNHMTKSTIPREMKNLFDGKGLQGFLHNPDICPNGDQYNKLVFDPN